METALLLGCDVQHTVYVRTMVLRGWIPQHDAYETLQKSDARQTDVTPTSVNKRLVPLYIS